jgi:CRISPR/Cas system CMR subunit Cmr6 (Cas7 group RAMP superfamily)
LARLGVKRHHILDMNIRTRRRLGVALLAGSILTGIILQLSTGELVMDDTKSQVSDAGINHSILIMHVVTFKARYAIPLATVAVVGVLCLFVPSRSPPRLQQ